MNTRASLGKRATLPRIVHSELAAQNEPEMKSVRSRPSLTIEESLVLRGNSLRRSLKRGNHSNMSPRNVPRFTERGNELPQITQLLCIASTINSAKTTFYPIDRRELGTPG
eukprot:scaffold20741_cov129-Skeletonema_marinoi.AAC.4